MLESTCTHPAVKELPFCVRLKFLKFSKFKSGLQLFIAHLCRKPCFR